MSVPTPPADADIAAVSAQLGRPARDVLAVGSRCPCGLPDVVLTAPRLADGTPFPTFYYLTCPVLTSAVSTLEAEGVMVSMQGRLAEEPDVAAQYRRAHEAFLAARAQHGDVPEIEGVSAGGMPDRVKCLHVLVAQSLACGQGVNPFGDEALQMLRDRGVLERTGCVEVP